MFDVLGNGVGPAPVGTSGSAGLAAYPCEVFISPILDLTVPNLGIEIVPARPGYVPEWLGSLWIFESITGTQTTAAVSKAGSNAAHTNLLGSGTGPDNADTNAAHPPSVGFGSQINTYSLQRIPNATVYLDVTSGASGTGGFSLRARCAIIVMWMAVIQ